MRADRLAVRIGPTDTAERRFRLIVLHGENGRQREAFGGCGKEEMLGHLRYLSFMKAIISDRH